MESRLQDCSAHNALYLMKNCLAIAKLTYLARTCPSWLFEEDLRAIDETFRSTLQDICNIAIDGATWRQASLPVDKGGLGLRRIEELALPAFVASSYSTEPLVAQLLSRTWMAHAGVDAYSEVSVGSDWRVAEAEAVWMSVSEKLSGSVFPLPSADQRGIKKRWDEPLAKQRLQNLLSDAREVLQSAEEQNPDPRSKQRQSAATNIALLVASLGTLLDNDYYRVAVVVRQGGPICANHTCRCGTPKNHFRHHGLSYRWSVSRHPRHHTLNDAVRRALGTAGIPSRL